MASKLGLANLCQNVARYGLLLVGSVVFLFALLSGSKELGGGLVGIIKNSPNSLPWLIILALLYLAWKKELLGGIIIFCLGVFIVVFFNNGPFFFWTTFLITLCIPLFGLLFVMSHLLRRKL